MDGSSVLTMVKYVLTGALRGAHDLTMVKSGRGTAEIRRRSTQVFRKAIAEEKLPNDVKELLPVALWALQMGLLVMFLYDSSENQRRTRRMADGALDLTLKLQGLAKPAVLKPIRIKVLLLLRQADLLPGSESNP